MCELILNGVSSIVCEFEQRAIIINTRHTPFECSKLGYSFKVCMDWTPVNEWFLFSTLQTDSYPQHRWSKVSFYFEHLVLCPFSYSYYTCSIFCCVARTFARIFDQFSFCSKLIETFRLFLLLLQLSLTLVSITFACTHTRGCSHTDT